MLITHRGPGGIQEKLLPCIMYNYVNICRSFAVNILLVK